MSRLPDSHNDSFRRLLEEGYVLYRRGPYVVGKVPFLDAGGALVEGLLVDVMNPVAGGAAGPPSDHRFYIVGGTPHKLDGSVLPLGGDNTAIDLFDGLSSSHWTSFKLKDNSNQYIEYVDFYEKFKTYFGVMSAPAKDRYPEYELTPYVGVESDDPNNPFVFDDTHSARAGINDLRDKLVGDRIAVIGVGGSGSYVVDLLSKSPVGSIVMFDDDDHNVHNSFRAPGPTVREDLGRKKVDLLQSRYEHSHKHITHHAVQVSADNFDLLEDVTFAFLCVDKERSRQSIAALLFEKGVPFIDVGMGLSRGAVGLGGIVRATFSRPGAEDRARAELINESHKDLDNEYHANIQTADLNALNAALAVALYKKFRGYYDEMPAVWQLLFTVPTNSLVRHLV